MTETASIKSYSAATRLLGPLTPFWIRKRANEGKEDPERTDERHGKASLQKPRGKLIWLHAASVGESVMLLPVIDRIIVHDPELKILVTSGTVTSAEVMADRLPPQAFHQYAPLDYPKAVKSFLNHWQPDMAIWAESEIWPNLIRHTKARGIPMALINARMSAKSMERWAGKAAKTGKALFGAFDLILAANKDTARGLSGIANRRVEMSGNLKDAAKPLPFDEKKLAVFKAALVGRPVWCAASTHPGEDEIMIAAHQKVLETHPNALLILALRHPERMPDVREYLKKRAVPYVVRSGGRKIQPQTQVFLYDTMGEMGLAYRLSELSFVCGSLIEGLAGHNPLEPARLGNAVLTGSHIASFADTYMPMFTFNAARRILDNDQIGPVISHLFSHPDNLQEIQNKAKAYADSRDAVLEYVWSELEPLIPGSDNAPA